MRGGSGVTRSGQLPLEGVGGLRVARRNALVAGGGGQTARQCNRTGRRQLAPRVAP